MQSRQPQGGRSLGPLWMTMRKAMHYFGFPRTQEHLFWTSCRQEMSFYWLSCWDFRICLLEQLAFADTPPSSPFLWVFKRLLKLTSNVMFSHEVSSIMWTRVSYVSLKMLVHALAKISQCLVHSVIMEFYVDTKQSFLLLQKLNHFLHLSLFNNSKLMWLKTHTLFSFTGTEHRTKKKWKRLSEM